MLAPDATVTAIVVELKDRLTRFGFRYIETLLAVQGQGIEVVNDSENPIEDLMADLVSIIYSFCSRLYGQRRAKRKTEKIVKALENQKTTAIDNRCDQSEKEEVKEKSAEREGKPECPCRQSKQHAKTRKRKKPQNHVISHVQ